MQRDIPNSFSIEDSILTNIVFKLPARENGGYINSGPGSTG